MMSREYILHRVRTAIGRSAGQAPDAPPPPLLNVPEISTERRIEMFTENLEKLAGLPQVASSPEDARARVAAILSGRPAVASNSDFLRSCGIHEIEGVVAGIADPAALREACATTEFGITSADFALADTGSLVMVASPERARLLSLLPPVHIAVVPIDRLLTGLDELFIRLPDPAAASSSTVIITGPSRTADIEQLLVRGVHGPGTIHVILV